jgi:hypothetical protein
MPRPSVPIAQPDKEPHPIRLVGVWRPVVIKDNWWEHTPIYQGVSNFHGGYILNPIDALNQDLPKPEPLYVSIVGPQGPARLEASNDTIELLPGAVFNVPARVSVWVNSASAGHRFTAVFGQWAPRFPPEATPPGSLINGKHRWPVEATTGLTRVMYAYLYQEYSDDDDLQEFVKVLNAMQQDYVDTFNALQLPVYPNPVIKGLLADWAIMGIYGYPRPVFYTSKSRRVGPLNTYWPNFAIPINMTRNIEPIGVLVSDDDLYKRCLTWHFQKGDGKYFNVRWLKRRIMRFLIGINGTCPHIDQTNRISVSFGPRYGVTIRVIDRDMKVFGGAVPNMFGCNGLLPGRKPSKPGANPTPPTIVGPVPPNTIFFDYTIYPTLPYEDRLKEAIDAGVLEMPFQFRFDVVIG